MVSTLPKAEGGNFETTPAGTFPARCYRFIDLGSHEQTYLGENKGLKRLVMVGFELPTELMETGEYAGKPFSIHKRYTWSTHEKATMRKDLESWRGRKFNDSDFGPGGFDVRKLLGVPCTLSISHSEKEGSTYANITGIGPLMKGIQMPDAINNPVFLSLEPQLFDRDIYESLSDKLKAFISDTPEYKSIVMGKKPNSHQAPLDREMEPAGARDFAPLPDDGDEIPF